ncbi:hypothetical protein [Microvirga sp. CF3016]|uniref:hypothetical protein n=1 Tax=Microvirga sp. CF3016 TaxID=3110181 RepID=UPI002E76DC03|nr:hypothetical protein [Microvirga sp. CF3016]MEE1612095.1 hypothetical protein [Microvirga sp. CF3016]
MRLTNVPSGLREELPSWRTDFDLVVKGERQTAGLQLLCMNILVLLEFRGGSRLESD